MRAGQIEAQEIGTLDLELLKLGGRVRGAGGFGGKKCPTVSCIAFRAVCFDSKSMVSGETTSEEISLAPEGPKFVEVRVRPVPFEIDPLRRKDATDVLRGQKVIVAARGDVTSRKQTNPMP